MLTFSIYKKTDLVSLLFVYHVTQKEQPNWSSFFFLVRRQQQKKPDPKINTTRDPVDLLQLVVLNRNPKQKTLLLLPENRTAKTKPFNRSILVNQRTLEQGSDTTCKNRHLQPLITSTDNSIVKSTHLQRKQKKKNEQCTSKLP